MNYRHDSSMENLREILDTPNDHAIRKSGYIDVILHVNIGREVVPLLVNTRYRFGQDKWRSPPMFDVEVLDAVPLRGDENTSRYVATLFRMLDTEFNQAIYHKAYDIFLRDVYPAWYKEGLR